MKKSIALLGSTGSIGTQTLNTARRCGFPVRALTANTRVQLLAEQARAFQVNLAVIADPSLYSELKLLLHDTSVRVMAGHEAVCEAASLPEADIVCNALVGMVGIVPTEAAICAGKTVALANKETIVSAGEYILSLAREHQVRILPVDSEHSGFFQCMEGRTDVTRLLLTASGGPFFGFNREQLRNVRYEQALRHPNWSMGAKITVDSATLMNKGLELIEAVRLFHVRPEDVQIIVHRESVVHAMVELTDGSILAYMSEPSMELPIQYALTYPERKPSGSRLSLSELGRLTFFEPDSSTFTAPEISRRAVRRGGLCTAALNGGNEALVSLFLDRMITFSQLMGLIDELGAYIDSGAADGTASNVKRILEADAAARAYMEERASRFFA